MNKLNKIANLGICSCLIASMGINTVSAAGINIVSQSQPQIHLDTVALMESKSNGSWFGDVSDNTQLYIPSGKQNQTISRITSLLLTALSPLIKDPALQYVCGTSAAVLAMADDDGSPARRYYINVKKRYREVYVGGTFSHFETMVILNIYDDSSYSHKVYSDTQIFSGQMLMNVNEN